MQTPSPSPLFAQTHKHTQFIKSQFSPVASSSCPSHCNGSSEVELSQTWLLAWIPPQECYATLWWAHSASCSHLSQEKPQFYKQGWEVMPPMCPSLPQPQVSQPCFVPRPLELIPGEPAQAPAIPRSHTGVSQPLSLLQQREVLGLPPAAHTLGREIKMRFTHTLQCDCREQCPLANGK